MSLVKMPKVGNRAYVYWLGEGWFTATITQCLPDEERCMIEWTDGDWSAEEAFYTNLFLDKVPDSDNIEIGTKVLFKQGLYYCGQNDDGVQCDDSGRDLSESKKKEFAERHLISDRWHLGEITSISNNHNDEPVYSGHHVEEDHPQVSNNNYLGYSFNFEGLRIINLRAPTVISKVADPRPVKEPSPPATGRDNKIQTGEQALVYWHGHGWFTAKILSILPGAQSCMIKWTDGNWSAEEAQIVDLFIDRVPDPATIDVKSKILFKQGLYYWGYDDNGTLCDSTGRDLSVAKKNALAEKGQISDRWHLGEITSITKSEDGGVIYNGQHVDTDEPQVSKNNYVGYYKTFEGLRINDLRAPSGTSTYNGNSSAIKSEIVSDLKPFIDSSALQLDSATELNVGDGAFVYWLGHGWFTATIETCLPDSCMVKWTDGNWCAEKALKANIALDKVPDLSKIWVEAKVLFKQGLYYCGNNDSGNRCDDSGRDLSESKKKELAEKRQISDRWHMGRITSISKMNKGVYLFSGTHVGKDDEHASKNNYEGYSYTFQYLKLEDLRKPLIEFPKKESCNDQPISTLQQVNEPSLPATDRNRSNKPQICNQDQAKKLSVGDLAFVFWLGHGWFTAIIEACLPDSCMVKWTDGNWCAEKALKTNIALDKIPDSSEIWVEAKVLFKQGLYYCGYNDSGNICDNSGRDLSKAKKKELAKKRQISDRWHMGRITKISKMSKGVNFYSGTHVGEDDEHASKNNFEGYSYTFQDLRLEDLRKLMSESPKNISRNVSSSDDSSSDDSSSDDSSRPTMMKKIVGAFRSFVNRFRNNGNR